MCFFFIIFFSHHSDTNRFLCHPHFDTDIDMPTSVVKGKSSSVIFTYNSCFLWSPVPFDVPEPLCEFFLGDLGTLNIFCYHSDEYVLIFSLNDGCLHWQ